MHSNAVKFRPRNNWVLIKIVNVGETEGGVLIPEISIEGKEFHVVACGPAVKDLEVGDKVLMVGKHGTEFFPLPGSHTLLVIKEECVVLVTEKG